MAVKVPCQLSRQCLLAPLWLHTAALPYGIELFPSLKKKCLFSPWLSFCRVPNCPLVSIEVPASSAVKNKQKPRRD